MLQILLGSPAASTCSFDSASEAGSEDTDLTSVVSNLSTRVVVRIVLTTLHS